MQKHGLVRAKKNNNFELLFNSYINLFQSPKLMSTVASYITVGITDCMNFKKTNKAYKGFSCTPFS